MIPSVHSAASARESERGLPIKLFQQPGLGKDLVGRYSPWMIPSIRESYMLFLIDCFVSIFANPSALP